MKVINSAGREYYIQRAKDGQMAKWCSTVTPIVLEFDGVQAEVYANAELSDWVYISFKDTVYCHWAKEAGGFDLLNECDLRISDHGRTYRKSLNTQDDHESVAPSSANGDNRSLSYEDIRAVVAYSDELSRLIASRLSDPNTVDHIYSKEFRSVVRKIVKEFHTRNFMYAFDYISWMDEARRLSDDPSTLAVADLETIRKLLVVHWRSDHRDGHKEHWETIAASGHLTCLLERLGELAKDMKQDVTSSKIVWQEDTKSGDVPRCDDIDDYVWPTVHDLMVGFVRIRKQITSQQLKMLQVNYQSGGRAVTMRELATATGYGDYKIANIQYGSLAKRLYNAIGYPAPRSRISKNTYWVLGLGEFIDRREFGLEMQCVMRPEVAEALERLEIVESLEPGIANEELGVADTAYTLDIDDVSKIIPTEDTEVQDYIVYHNPDVMGPLEHNSGFRVFTNKGISKTNIGDRVWLITGSGKPRRFFLARWFYIDAFNAGEDRGFKICISGSVGQNFDPFIEIEQEEWFVQLKRDQGNFAFGFSRITTPGTANRLEMLANN